MSALKSSPGQPEMIGGRYQIERQLGRGGMGSVWQARDLTLQCLVAIKIIDPAIATSADAV